MIVHSSDESRDARQPTELDRTAMDLLFENAADFMNAGIKLLFSEAADRGTAKVAIVSIQTSMELLAKFRLVEAMGFAKLVDGEPPADPAHVRMGGFRSISYRRTLEAMNGVEALSEIDRDLFDDAASLRNKLVHFAGNPELAELRVTCAHLSVRALNRFASAGWRDMGDFSNHCRLLSGVALEILTTFEPYRAEAVDSALDDPDSEKVLRCWECKVDALSLRACGSYFCHCCGLSAHSDVAEFANCYSCGVTNGVVYDPLNHSRRGHDGICLFCGIRQWTRLRE